MVVRRLPQRGRRAVLALVALGLAGLSAWHAAATVLGGENPVLVQKMDPTNPEALPMLVDLQSAKSAPPGMQLANSAALGLPSPRMVPLLRRTLARQPLVPRALRQLAAYERKQGHRASSRTLLELGGRVSRRDPLLDIILARNAALANQPAAIINHLDAALSTFRSADAQIFPLLMQPLASADFRHYMKAYMDRPWAEPFMFYAAQNAKPRDVLDLALSAPVVQKQPRFERFRTELVAHLVAGGASGQALDYVGRIAPDRAALAAIGITPATVDPRFAPVTWRLTNANGIYLTPEAGGLIVAVDPAARGRALERVMSLGRGRYRLDATSDIAADQQFVNQSWSVACLRGADDQVIARHDGAVRSGRLDLPFDIPAGCDAVRFALDIVSDSDQNAAEYRIGSIRLLPGAQP